MQFNPDNAPDWKTPNTPEAIGFCLAETAHRLAGGPVAVAVRDPFTQVATVVAISLGTDKRLLGEQVTSDSAAGRAMLGRMTVRGSGAEELLGSTRSDRRHLETTGLVLPIRNEDRGIGALVVFTPHHTAEGSVTDMLAALADDAGPLIGEMIAQRVALEEGLIDSVTRYPNGEGLERALHQHIWTHCSLLRTDIDRFDEMSEGHGTVVMKHVAHVLRRNLRDDDVAACIDRGRFALFVPDTPLGAAITVAERLQAAVLATAFRVNGEQPVSCSFAVAGIPETVDTIDDLLAAATKASIETGTGVVVVRQIPEPAASLDMPVLIVDDDVGIRRSHTRMLERAGFTVSSVDNAVAAFEELQKQSFGAILLDIQMPGLTGTSFFEQLEERLPHMASRVVFLSGFVDENDTHEFLVRSGQPFLAKPTQLDELVETVRQMVERSKRESGRYARPGENGPELNA